MDIEKKSMLLLAKCINSSESELALESIKAANYNPC